MSLKFFLYVNPEALESGGDEIRVTAHYMFGYCPQTVTAYKEMVATLRKTFPQAKDDEIGLHQIVASDTYKGFTLIVWRTNISRKTLGLPDAKGYAALVKKMEVDHPTRSFPALPEYEGWYVTAYPCRYSY